MLSKIHELPQYQDFLISEQRKGLIPPDLYDALIPEYFDGLQILDFGCGLGYTGAFYSEKFADHDDFHIYACDHQVELIDYLWKRITDNDFKNLTVFHMPERSRLHFPKWVPPVHHLFLSLSLAATDNPVDILKTLRPMILDEGLIHIIEWDKDKSHRELDEIYPPKNRLSLKQIESYLDQAKYTMVRTYRVAGPYIALTAKPYFGEKPDTKAREKNQKETPPAPRPAAPVAINPEPAPAASQEAAPNESPSHDLKPPAQEKAAPGQGAPAENPAHEFEAPTQKNTPNEQEPPGENPAHEIEAPAQKNTPNEQKPPGENPAHEIEAPAQKNTPNEQKPPGENPAHEIEAPAQEKTAPDQSAPDENPSHEFETPDLDSSKEPPEK